MKLFHFFFISVFLFGLVGEAKILDTDLQSLEQIPRLLNVPRSCRKAADDILDKLQSYHLYAAQSDSMDSENAKTARAVYGSITESLQKLESDGKCFQPVAKSYVLASFAYLESKKDQALLKLSTNILNEPMIKFDLLVPKKRQEMSCEWEKPGERYTYHIYGGYFCGDHRIMVDPYLPPVNLGASFLHEIDHLVRDNVGFQFADSILPQQVREWILYDEVLATSVAAFYEVRLTFPPERLIRDNFWIGKKINPLVNAKHSYQLDFDVNLFLPEGPIAHASKILEKDSDSDLKTFLTKSGLVWCPNIYVNSQLHDLWSQVFTNLYPSYFTGTSSLKLTAPFLPLNQSSYFPMIDVLHRYKCSSVEPLLYLNEKEFFTSQSSSSLLFSSLKKSILKQMGEYSIHQSEDCYETSRTLRDDFAVSQGQEIRDLWGNIRKPGYVTDYIGMCSQDANGNEGGHTGNEGGHTGNEGGGHTGNEGGHTETESARP